MTYAVYPALFPDESSESDDEGEAEEFHLIDAQEGIGLGIQMRCSAHTYNLVASSDANAAMDDATFKTAFRYFPKKSFHLFEN